MRSQNGITGEKRRDEGHHTHVHIANFFPTNSLPTWNTCSEASGVLPYVAMGRLIPESKEGSMYRAKWPQAAAAPPQPIPPGSWLNPAPHHCKFPLMPVAGNTCVTWRVQVYGNILCGCARLCTQQRTFVLSCACINQHMKAWKRRAGDAMRITLVHLHRHYIIDERHTTEESVKGFAEPEMMWGSRSCNKLKTGHLRRTALCVP